MKFIEILSRIKSVLSTFGGVEMSFGKPINIGDTTIIPVAKTSMGLGGGGGSSPVSHQKKDKQDTKPSDIDEPLTETPMTNEGGGGGGGIKTEPIGIYLIKGDKVKFYPVIGVKEIAAVFAILSIFLLRVFKKKRK